MKKLLVIISMVAMCGIIVGCANSWPKKNNGFQRQVVLVSGHPNWKPIMYKSGQNIVGISVDVTKSVFKDIGFDVNAKYMGTWDVVQEKAKQWAIDGIVALYKTKEREQYLEYSIAYAQDPIVLFFSGGKLFAYTGKQNLLGKKGVAIVGDSYGQTIDDYIVSAKLDITRVATPEAAFAMIKNGKADYFIYSLYAGKNVIEQKLLKGIQESSIVSSQPFYIGISKKSPYVKYMKEINIALKKLIKSNKIPQG